MIGASPYELVFLFEVIAHGKCDHRALVVNRVQIGIVCTGNWAQFSQGARCVELPAHDGTNLGRAELCGKMASGFSALFFNLSDFLKPEYRHN